MNTRTSLALAVLAAAALLLTACGTADTSNADALPPAASPADVPAASGACLEGEPDCNDMGAVNPPGPIPLDGDSTNAGALVDGGLTVSEALATDTTGIIAVQGFLLDDGTGARLCEALAESYPPQCGGTSIPVVGYEEMVDVPLSSAQGMTWTDSTVTFFGELVDGVFTVDPTVAG